ncbi:MAG TPA: hypothetical protein VF746_16870 [Longimicrobium sp.]
MNLLALPNFRLSPSSPTARAFLRRGLDDFHRAARHVWLLPTVHSAERPDFRRLLLAGRGTPAAKHALLAALAAEHGVPVRLVLAVYEMDEENTPGVGEVLRRHGLDAVLDAGCHLLYEGRRISLTRDEGTLDRIVFLHEEPIAPEHIAAYKLAVYQRLLWDWMQPRGLTIGQAWEVREECLAALERASAP